MNEASEVRTIRSAEESSNGGSEIIRKLLKGGGEAAKSELP